MRPPILAIDFDGTIVTQVAYPDIGPLRPNAKERIIDLYTKYNCEIIIWTSRGPDDIDRIIQFLKDNEIPYAKINENSDHNKFKTSCKAYADIYIDDRCLGGIPDWETIYNLVVAYITSPEFTNPAEDGTSYTPSTIDRLNIWSNYRQEVVENVFGQFSKVMGAILNEVGNQILGFVKILEKIDYYHFEAEEGDNRNIVVIRLKGISTPIILAMDDAEAEKALKPMEGQRCNVDMPLREFATNNGLLAGLGM